MDDNKTPWTAFVTNRLAPAIAASLGSYLMTQASLSGQDFSILGFGSETIKSSLVFGLTVLFTDPMAYIKALSVGILSVRRFYGSAKNEVENALNQPLEEDKKE